MSAIARGLYWQLLALQWQDGFVPDDMWTAFRLLDVDDGDREVLAEIWETAISHFVPHPLDPIRLINPRQATERWRAIDLSASRSNAGREGGKKSGKMRQTVSADDSATSKRCLSKAEAKPKQPRKDIDLDKETDKQNVSKDTGKPDVENSDGPWNKRLAPIARELGGESGIANWLRWAKTKDIDECERIMIGFKAMRERGAIWVKPGEPCTPAVLSCVHDGQPIENAAIKEYWWITNPKPESGQLTRIQA